MSGTASGGRAQTPRTSPPAGNGDRKAPDPEILATRTLEALKMALGISKRITDDGQNVLCPTCNKLASVGKKFKLFADGGWKHFGSGGCHGDAITVLTGEPLKLSFPDAVRLLNGKPTRVKVEMPTEMPQLAAVETFRATVDLEVYNGILIYGRKTGGIEAAIDFYGQWHIDPDVVRESGAVYITDPKHFEENILKRFSLDRLVACGLFVITTKGRPYSLLNENWPLVEPHRHPATGDVLYAQFRASDAQYARYLEHKAGKRPYEGSQKFLGIKGAPPTAQVGCGLPRLESLEPGATVYIVEGFKDTLAARTLGAEAFGIPGVDHRPADKICALLARHRVEVGLDGDDAGVKHRDDLVEFLRRKGVDAHPKDMVAGMDVTDRLVERYARAGCTCPACTNLAPRLGL